MSLFDRFNKKTSSGLFVPAASEFKEVTEIPGNGSYNAVAGSLGYNSEQWFLHMDGYDPEAEIQGVGLEVFTGKVLFVQTKKTVLRVAAPKLQYFLRDANEELLDSSKVTGVLSDGVVNKSLSIDFLARVLNLEDTDPNGIYFSDKIGMYLYFNNGVLVDYQPADGLGEYAKLWKQLNSEMVERYELVAQKYWGNNHKQVLHEINTQADGWAGVPQALNNEFIELHQAELNTYNFHMLLVAHYGKKITLPEFLTLNHGRYEEVPDKSTADLAVYKVGKFHYVFGLDGTLYESVLQ